MYTEYAKHLGNSNTCRCSFTSKHASQIAQSQWFGLKGCVSKTTLAITSKLSLSVDHSPHNVIYGAILNCMMKAKWSVLQIQSPSTVQCSESRGVWSASPDSEG